MGGEGAAGLTAEEGGGGGRTPSRQQRCYLAAAVCHLIAGTVRGWGAPLPAVHSCPRGRTAPPQLFPVLQLGCLIGDLSQHGEATQWGGGGGHGGEEGKRGATGAAGGCWGRARHDSWKEQGRQAPEQTEKRAGARERTCPWEPGLGRGTQGLSPRTQLCGCGSQGTGVLEGTVT